MTSILSKDAPLEQSIERMSSLLTSLGFEIEEYDWLNPIPNVWSVRIADKKSQLFSAGGKGRTQLAARASALGEFCERLSCNYYFADYYFGKELAASQFVHYPSERWFSVTSDQIPVGLLDEATISHYNMDDELVASMLIDTNSGDRRRGICALPFTKQRDQELVWIPVSIIGNLYASNGMAAGNTQYEARVQAISEIFERHIKTTIISSGISLPRIPDEVVARYPSIAESIQSLKDSGFIVYVLDASLGGKFPLVNVTIINSRDGGCFASFGAHPKFEVAFERAITELLQGRDLGQLDNLPGLEFDISRVADQQNLERHFSDSSGLVSWELLSSTSDYIYTEWNIEGDAKAEFDHLCYLIHKVDMDIYIADFDHLGIYSCRVIVPGMSEIYPVEKLVRGSNNMAIDFRERILALAALNINEIDELFDYLDTVECDEHQLVTDFIGVVADEGSLFDGMRLVELKLLMSLSLGNLDLALDYSEWVLQLGGMTIKREQLHRCLNHVLKFTVLGEGRLSDWDAVLNEMYGSLLLDRCKGMVKGKRVFEDFPVFGLDLAGLERHKTMLNVYRVLQRMKASVA